KQFWNTDVVKRTGDVTRLQALVDKKRIVITEEVVCEVLQLNDAEGQRFNFLKYIFESLVRNVDSSSKFYMKNWIRSMRKLINIDWNAALDHVQSKKPQYIKRYHGIKKKPQTESKAHKNMISYLRNTEGYKMEFFKGKTYDEILPIFQARFDANMKFLFKSREEIEKEDEEIIKSINKTPAQKAAKRRKLSEEAQEADDLRRRLEIIQDEDDDVFVEATPLAQKVPVVDYQVVVIDNKPKYKIIKQMTLINSTSASQLY
nr:hypothetical protein [Tanacetum cinerariifolium]